MSKVLAALLLAFLLGVPEVTSAAPIARVNYNFNLGSGEQQVSGDSLPLQTSSGSNAFGPYTISLTADHGSLGAYAELTGRDLLNPYIVFNDELTIVSGTLPVGTLVNLAVSLNLDYALSINAGLVGGGDCTNSAARIQASLVLGGNALQYSDDYCLGVQIDSRTAVMQFHVGDIVPLSANLILTAGAGNCCESGYALSDALHTLTFFANPVGDDFTYTSLTGAPYLSPATKSVPEPSILTLFGAGLVSLGALRRRPKTKG